MERYVIGIDQSTQGTKAMLFDQAGKLILRTDLSHRQIVDGQGWVSHDLNEIYHNTVAVVRQLVEQSGISTGQIAAIGISNQRETTCMWDKVTGEPIDHAIVWQCSRAKNIEERIGALHQNEYIQRTTGIPLSAYYPACKMTWLKEAHPEIPLEDGNVCFGTIDAWLVYKLTEDHAFKTDYSNASRTQLFNLETLKWDEKLCDMFGIPVSALPEVCDSNSLFGYTTLEGFFEEPVPIHAALGDSHGALFGQGCHSVGMIKATYGTGSSLMMNIGETPVFSTHGIATSLAWKMGEKAEYVLEGNLNYTGAVITWLKDDLKMIATPAESGALAESANREDRTYLVPAFSGLGAPYWDSDAVAAYYGMSRTTGRAELVKAALESIAYQINDLVVAMEQDTGLEIPEVRVDGGPTHNEYLMQFQSDIFQKQVAIPAYEELSGIGAAYAAGIAVGLYDKESLFTNAERKIYVPKMSADMRDLKYAGWKEAVGKVLTKK